MTKRYRVLLSLIFITGVLLGIPAAVFGSQSDVSPREQAAALISGIAMIIFGIVGFVATTRAASGKTLRVSIVCGAGELISFVLLLVFGP
jgi:uncharacterized membrane protein